MSRPIYPTQLRDHSGNEVRLPAKPFATGGEGAVFDVVGRPELVAKLYSKPQSRERCDKLKAMAKLCSPELLKIAAWPTATLSNGNPTAVEGILMPRIVNHKEIHHLYSVAQRKKDFPEADWGFLLHTARNCAIAFESIHRHGHVVGDVNQKNVMVSKKGIVALVDCDSFQVREGNRVFRCGVGVPEYTPPELHGRKFTDLDRDANHDLFGLAVMIFHLLMMGRHPFSGVPQVSIDIPIEKAITEGFYAYASNPTKLKPPPNVPPLTMLDATTRSLFERAFCSPQRPTATEWHRTLDAAMKGLQQCKNDSRHSYLAGNSCPWCQLIAVNRLMLFIPSHAMAGATFRIEDIQHLIQKLTSKQLVFPFYTRPQPHLPVHVTLPAGLHAITKPKLLPHPPPPAPLQKPVLAPIPHPPALLDRPILRTLPPVPVMPIAPRLIPHPPAPVESPRPKLHAKPLPPPYPPVPSPGPPDPFLANLSIAGALAGVPVFFLARPVGLTMILAFGAWWLLMFTTKGIRLELARKSLQREHEAECAQMDEKYKEQVQPIEKANKRLLYAWEMANTAKAVEHNRACRDVDEENHRRLTPWETAKAVIQADYQRALQEIEQANRRVLALWEAENSARRAAYDTVRDEIEQENRRLTGAWDSLTASRQDEHDRKCREIDSKNGQLIAAWEYANTPWTAELKLWRDRAQAIEVKIKQLEHELVSHRSSAVSRFQARKDGANGVLKSHDGARLDYERELRQAEKDSKRIQLEEHLDKSLICNAKLKGITRDRILTLESFGIETAKDVEILNQQKVPGIGPVLSDRLFDWRYKLASSFKYPQGLPESEKRRIATRYAPVLLPLRQAIQTAINDLDAIEASHRTSESERIKVIAASVQELAIAEAYVRTMESI